MAYPCTSSTPNHKSATSENGLDRTFIYRLLIHNNTTTLIHGMLRNAKHMFDNYPAEVSAEIRAAIDIAIADPNVRLKQLLLFMIISRSPSMKEALCKGDASNPSIVPENNARANRFFAALDKIIAAIPCSSSPHPNLIAREIWIAYLNA